MTGVCGVYCPLRDLSRKFGYWFWIHICVVQRKSGWWGASKREKMDGWYQDHILLLVSLLARVSGSEQG